MNLDDLSDVKPLGVRIRISDGVHGMWMGRQLCEVRGYCAPWTNEKILDYFTDLCKFYDAWSESASHALLPDTVADLQALELEGDTFNRWKLIRSYVEGAYNKYVDESLLSIMKMLGVSPTLWMQACTTGGLPKCFEASDDFVDGLENYYMSHEKIVWKQLGEHFGLKPKMMKNLCRIFEKRHMVKYGYKTLDRRVAKKILNEMALTTNLTPTQICNEVFRRTEVRFHISAVTKIRRRKNSHTGISDSHTGTLGLPETNGRVRT